MIYPDVQAWKITSNFPLTRVGTTEFKLPFNVRRPDGIHVLTPEISVFVDLPAELKGSHMSRNIEVVTEVRNAGEEFHSLEEICERISRELLRKHDYAECSEVIMRTDYFLEKENPTGKKNTEHYILVAEALSRWGPSREITTTKVIGVEVTGMTACPCGMETTRALYLDKGEQTSADCAEGSSDSEGEGAQNLQPPTITHNQRNVSKLFIETPDDHEVEANELIDIVEGALSSPSYGILKRKDEAAVIWNAHNAPKFVEDVVRDILKEVVRRYHHLDDSAVVTVSSTSLESIHKHNAFAECVMKMKELKEIYLQNVNSAEKD